MRLRGLVGLIVAWTWAAACTASVDGGEVEPSGDGVRPSGDDPAADDGHDDSPPGDDAVQPPAEPPEDDRPLPPPPAGPAGTCWGALHFDAGCSRDRASATWEVALFPGDASMSATVSTNAAANAVVISWGPAGAASSVRWSDALVARLPGQPDDGRFGALRLVVPGTAADSMEVVHASGSSARNAWLDHWQDQPPGIVSPGFSAAYYEVDGSPLTWESSPAAGGGVDVAHTVERAGVQHVHHVVVDGAGATHYEYRRLEGGQEREAWISDDGRAWHRTDAAGERAMTGEGEQQAWSIDLPHAFQAEGIALEARHAIWEAEMGWLEGRFGGLSAPLVDGYGAISDLWVDVETASVRSFAVMYWDGTVLHEWDAGDGGLADGQEFPSTYQTDRGSRLEVSLDGTPVVAVAAAAEESQVRVTVEDLLPAGTSLETAWHWEIVFESYDGLPTGEVAIERTTEAGCQRQLSYDFGATWAAAACG